MKAIDGSVWAIEQSLVRPLGVALERINAGEGVPEELAKRLTPKQDERIAGSEGAIAVMQVSGFIAQHPDIFMALFGGTSTAALGAAITAAADDASIKAIVLHVDSPGGSVYGMPELAACIREARKKKSIIAHVDSFAASAAYWIASQAEEVIVSPGGDVGSIGVYMMHQDWSQALEESGVKTSFIYAGKYKVEGNYTEPLADDTREYFQARVDEHYRNFVNDVALGRNVDASKVLSDFGQGRMVSATKALKAGMVDRVATFTETLSRFMGSKPNFTNRRRKLALQEKE
jgi:signal peptide peptidase SppA